MARLFIIAHAPLASALKAVAEHTFPDSASRLDVLDVTADMPPEEIESRARSVLAKSPAAETLILTDVFGAMPATVAQRLGDGHQVRVLTGVNVPMLWRTLVYAAEPLDALVARALAGASQGVMQVATTKPQTQTGYVARTSQDGSVGHGSSPGEQGAAGVATSTLVVKRAQTKSLSVTTQEEAVADPTELLNASEISRLLEVDESQVLQLERTGRLFALMRAGRSEREYPAFQAWSGIAGEALAGVLSELRSTSGAVAYGFFTSPTDLLGGLTPVETMIGYLTSSRSLAPETKELLAAPAPERLGSVVGAAMAEAELRAAW
ncbi:MAG: hypothetical protein ABL916_11385 [Burkholderiaceae bacterium]